MAEERPQNELASQSRGVASEGRGGRARARACSQDALGRKKLIPWSNASKWPDLSVQKLAVRPKMRSCSSAGALKNALRSAASDMALVSRGPFLSVERDVSVS